MARIHLINEGRQLICLPGVTLFQLENALKPLGAPDSVIGSSCMGASVFGGICNNSGGALIHRGPAYTQMALFARIDDTGEVQFVNYLGVRLGNELAGRSGRTPGEGEKHTSEAKRSARVRTLLGAKLSSTIARRSYIASSRTSLPLAPNSFLLTRWESQMKSSFIFRKKIVLITHAWSGVTAKASVWTRAAQDIS